jgi:dihydropteroate synthase
MARHPAPPSLRVRGTELRFGERTYVMGIVNVTPDSFSGDGVLAADVDLIAGAIDQAAAMVSAGADLIDIGGESTRPGSAPVSVADELARVVDVIAAVRARLPQVPISIDTIKPAVALAALDAGADIVNDVSAVSGGAPLAALAADRSAPYVLMHSRSQAEYTDVVAEVVSDLDEAIADAVASGCDPASLIIDPGIGFGKTAEQNLALLGGLEALRSLGRPILLGTSRKSTIGLVLEAPVGERLEGTLATTALGIAAGVDIVRVHDVAPNVRAARMSDAIVRGGWHDADDTGLIAGTRT